MPFTVFVQFLDEDAYPHMVAFEKPGRKPGKEALSYELGSKASLNAKYAKYRKENPKIFC
jgi:hypothetical protein